MFPLIFSEVLGVSEGRCVGVLEEFYVKSCCLSKDLGVSSIVSFIALALKMGECQLGITRPSV